MDKKQANTRYRDGKNNVKLNVIVYLWEEDGVNFVYAPSLDLTGYGMNVDEAQESFKTVLDEFMKYTHNKKTIFKELEKLGWAVNKRRRKVVSPDFEELLDHNKHFNDLYKTKNLTKSSSDIDLQLA